MPNATHTPGPWIARRNKSYWQVDPVVGAGGENPFQVADTCSSDPDNPDGGLQEANARLIAAAPDLLEALKAVLLVLDAQNIIYIERGSACWRRIKTAIAKAESR